VSRPVDAKQRRAQHEEREFAERYGTPAPRGPIVPAVEEKAPIAARAGRGILSWFKTAAVVLGVFYVIGFGLTTWFVTSGSGRRFGYPYSMVSTTRSAYAGTKPGLQYRLPTDPTITPQAAGTALYSLYPRTGFGSASIRAPGVKQKEIESPPAVPWRSVPLPADLFPPRGSASSSGIGGLPRNIQILDLARGPLNQRQRDGLRLVGTAEAWSAFDRVARAPSIDVIGTRFELPFGNEARGWYIQPGNFGAFRDFMYATYMRATWHLSEGRRDSAEFALRALISVGHAIMENGSTLNEQTTGAGLARAGSDALARFFELQGDPRGKELAAAAKAAEAAAQAAAQSSPGTSSGDVGGLQQRLVEWLNDPLTTRSMRVDVARALRNTTCRSVRGVILGPAPQVQAALDAMRKDFMRYPSDEALMRIVDAEFETPLTGGANMIGPLAGFSEFVSRVYFNPRLGSCVITRLGGP
jgi:hypothetical protein